MPPKSSSLALPLRRTSRATTRKSTPNLKVSATTAAAKSAPAADVSPETPTTTTTTTTTTQEPSPSSLASPKPTPIAFAEAAANRLTSKFSREDAREEAQSVTNPSETDLNIDTAETTGKMGADETLRERVSAEPENVAIVANVVENIAESGQETAQNGGTKTGSKTVLKKTVRVVKKVVKKKVPKRVQTGQGILLNEESEKLEDSNGGETPNPSVLGEVEVENPNLIEPDSREFENPKPNDTVSVESENSKSDVNVIAEAENSDSYPIVIVSMEVEKPSADVDAQMKVAIAKDSDSCEGEKDVSLTKILYEFPVLDPVGAQSEGDEGEMAVSLEDQDVALVGGKTHDPETTENLIFESVEGEEGVKEKVDNSEVGGLKAEAGLGDGVLLSGEMEALERRRRRKTEIFIGGLDKDAKEEDIREVFEEVGEVLEVRLKMNGKTGKNKGFAFVRYASAVDAKKALAKFDKVEICGRQCGTAPVDGNDTIFLGNINKKWKSEDVVKLLQEIGIEKIDEVTVVADPNNIEFNRGFAFLELETYKDAQNAYNKLQKKDVFGKNLKIKVAWAEPMIEPDEEEMVQVKSVYAEYIPALWDEEKVRDYFKKFGEIQNVVLSRNLRSSKRKDFAFVTYTIREAAIACIEAFSHENLNDEGSKANVKVSLAKPLQKAKQTKYIPNPTSKKLAKENWKAAQNFIKPHEPRNKGKATGSKYKDNGVDRMSSTTSELVQLLREQASWGQTRPALGIGSIDLDYSYDSPGKKRPFSVVGDDPHYSDSRRYPRTRLESSYPIANPSALSQGFGMTSLPHYHRPGAGFTSESIHGVDDYPSYSQTRQEAPYHGSTGIYRRY